MTAFIIFIVTLALFMLWYIVVYNRFIGLRNETKNAYAQIDVQLKRRYDLIPNLVEVARGYMSHERETLEAVALARSAAVTAANNAKQNPTSAGALAALAGAEGLLGAGLGRLMALSESYPELKANAEMQRLSEEISSTENRIGFARQAYNDTVLAFNNAVQVFPQSIVAGLSRFPALPMLQSTQSEEERQAPKVQF